MSELLMFLNMLGWLMGIVGVIAIWVNHSMRKERERERRSEADRKDSALNP
jgi:hypothetical protein